MEFPWGITNRRPCEPADSSAQQSPACEGKVRLRDFEGCAAEVALTGSIEVARKPDVYRYQSIHRLA